MNCLPKNEGHQKMSSQLSNYLNQPLSIRDRGIEKRLVLAPMTQIGNIAFRELLSMFGGYGLLFTEMCSAKRVPNENRHVSPYFRWRDEESSHLVCQLFGAEPEIMAAAARRIEREGFFGVDINMGCSVSTICRQNCGAALMKSPDLAIQITEAVRKAVSIPLFVKFRTGWNDDPRPAVEMAKKLEHAGADALTFHPRVAPDRRSRPPKWEYIGMIKQAVSIPVFGNGDVFDSRDCLNMLRQTGCDGIALGRLAVAKPWIFSQWTEGTEPGPDIYSDTAIRMAELLTKHYDPTRAIGRFKKFALYFSANFRFAHTFYSRMRNVKDMAAAKEVVRHFFRGNPELTSRPNMNFFN